MHRPVLKPNYVEKNTETQETQEKLNATQQHKGLNVFQLNKTNDGSTLLKREEHTGTTCIHMSFIN